MGAHCDHPLIYPMIKVGSYLRKSERMIAKITFPTPIHTGPHHNPNTYPQVALVSGPHQSPHPRYQFVRLKSELQCSSLSTPKNAHLEILQDGMDNTRRGGSTCPPLDYPSREVHRSTSQTDEYNTKNVTDTRSGHDERYY